METKTYDSKKVAGKLASRLEKMIEKDRKERELKRGLRLLNIAKRGMIVSLILASSACSVFDPGAAGNSTGADAYEYSIPESGYIERTTRITRAPSGNPELSGGKMYNRRSFSDWLFSNSSDGGLK